MKDIASKWKAESLMVKDHQKHLALAHVRAHLRSQECSAYLHTSSLICKAGPDYIESFQKLTTEDRKWVVSMLLEEGLVTRCDEVKGYRLKVVSVMRDYGKHDRDDAPADSRALHG